MISGMACFNQCTTLLFTCFGFSTNLHKSSNPSITRIIQTALTGWEEPRFWYTVSIHQDGYRQNGDRLPAKCTHPIRCHINPLGSHCQTGQQARLQPPDWFAGHANQPDLSAARADPQSSLDAGNQWCAGEPLVWWVAFMFRNKFQEYHILLGNFHLDVWSATKVMRCGGVLNWGYP